MLRPGPTRRSSAVIDIVCAGNRSLNIVQSADKYFELAADPNFVLDFSNEYFDTITIAEGDRFGTEEMPSFITKLSKKYRQGIVRKTVKEASTQKHERTDLRGNVEV